MVAEVIINTTAKQLNRIFDYIIPDELQNVVKPGCRVVVPFGNKKQEEGFVVNIKPSSEFANKCIIRVEDDFITPANIKLAVLMAKRYFCNISDCLKLMLPPGTVTKNVENRVKDKTLDFVYLDKDIEEIDFCIEAGTIKSPKHIRILEFLKENDGIYIGDLESITDTTRQVIKTLEKKGFVKIEQGKVERNPFEHKNVKKDKPLKLTEEQQYCYNSVLDCINENKFSEFLLYGVTGSRKNRSVFAINRRSFKKR